MKVAFLTAGLSEIRGGGVLLCNYTKALNKYCNVNATVYSVEGLHANYAKLRDVLDKDTMARVKFVELPCEWKKENKLMRTLRFFKSLLWDAGETDIIDAMQLLTLRRGMGKYLPKITYYKDLLLRCLESNDIVHMGAWHALYTFVASTLKDRLGYKTVVHTIFHPRPLGLMEWSTCRKTLSRMNAVTTSTPWEENFFKERGLSNVYFVGEGVDIERIEHETTEMHAGEDVFTVIYLGARTYGKGYYHALLAVNVFAKEVGYDNVHMIVIGRGEDVPTAPQSVLRNASEAYNALKQHGCVEEYTFVSEREKLRCLKRAHIVLLPSKAETIPLVTLEAWVLKKPSILGDIPTVRSVVGQDGNGAVLVNYGDIHGMVQKLEHFYKNQNLLSSVGLRGHDILMKSGSLKSLSARLLSVYKKILG